MTDRTRQLFMVSVWDDDSIDIEQISSHDRFHADEMAAGIMWLSGVAWSHNHRTAASNEGSPSTADAIAAPVTTPPPAVVTGGGTHPYDPLYGVLSPLGYSTGVVK